MAFQPTEHGALVVARIQYADEIYTNHIWARRPDFTDDDLQSLVNVVKTAYVAEVLDDFTVSTTFIPFKGYDMRSAEGSVLQDVSGSVPCTGGTLENPGSIACVLTLRTAKRGRAHRGRLYIGPMKSENIADGVWTSAAVDEVEALGLKLEQNISGAGWIWGVRSGTLDGVPRDPAIITEITSWEVRSNKVGSQRLRVDRI